jgi:hypothetical protein
VLQQAYFEVPDQLAQMLAASRFGAKAGVKFINNKPLWLTAFALPSHPNNIFN